MHCIVQSWLRVKDTDRSLNMAAFSNAKQRQTPRPTILTEGQIIAITILLSRQISRVKYLAAIFRLAPKITRRDPDSGSVVWLLRSGMSLHV